jgi:Spy/CpxP family protein refolding chaperone
MDITNKRNWQVRLAALLIFLLGFAAGALALNVYKRWGRAGALVSRQERFERMIDSLQLTPEQKTQVDQILSDTRTQLQTLRKESEPRVSDIRKQADERLQKILTAEQWKQFEQEREKMRGREHRGRGNNSGDATPR